jgi:hypothetical protein
MSRLDEIKEKMKRDAAQKLAEVKAVAVAELEAEGLKPEVVLASPKEVIVTGPATAQEVQQIQQFNTAAPVPSPESPSNLSNVRIFRSRVPGSSFVMAEGYTIYFTHGWYETSDPSEIKQLEGVANKVPTVYTDEHEKEILAAVMEARKQGFAGSIGEAMAQQLSQEQRIAALKTGSFGAAVPPLMLSTPAGMPAGVTATEAATTEASLRSAIRAASAQSNS